MNITIFLNENLKHNYKSAYSIIRCHLKYLNGKLIYLKVVFQQKSIKYLKNLIYVCEKLHSNIFI